MKTKSAKPANPAPEAAHDELIRRLQELIAEHLPALLRESQAMSTHLDALGEVRRDISLKARLGSSPAPLFDRATVALSVHAVGVLGEEKGRVLVEHAIRAPKPAARNEEDPGQATLAL